MTTTASQKKKKHPMAGQTMSGADAVIQVLADEGVDTVFGYSGGAILPTYDAIFRYNENHKDKQIRLVVPANEQGAGFMAAGHARASGDVGVFLVTSGPGATNSVTPIRDCMADSVPVVLITGQVPRAAIGTDAFQEAPVFNVMSPCAKHVFLVKREDQIEETMRTAFDIARSGRPGPVVVDLPKDIQNFVGEFKGEGKLKFHGYEDRIRKLRESRVSKENGEEFFRMLGECERPLIYAGGGIINANAAEELREFSHKFNIPVVTTLMGIGGMDTKDDLALHMLGMHGTAYANYAVEDCDFLLAAGSRFDDRVAGKASEFAPLAKYIAHIDIDAAEIGKVKAVQWSHVGDAKNALRDLIQQGKDFKKSFDPWIKHVKALKEKHAMNYNRSSELLQPYYVLEILNEFTGGNAIITTGVGQHQMWAAQYLDFREPRTWLTSGSMGTMGFGLPASVGAQLARPDKTVVNVDGDGSLRMNLGELETLTTYDIPVKVLLINNLGDGMVRQWQNLYFGDRFSGSDKSLHKKDFLKAAEADGFGFAKRLKDKKDAKKLIKAFVEYEGPALLEALIDPNAPVYPMVGPGLGYKDMITGQYIVPREQQKFAQEAEGEKDMTKIPELF